MVFRSANAWLVFAVCLAGGSLARGDHHEGKSLFDGKTLAGWQGNPKLWRVEDGAITGESTDEAPLKHNEFLIWDGEVGDFVLTLKFRIEGRGVQNSGVQYRSKRHPEVGKYVVGGYQADIDGKGQYMGILYEERGRGILALQGQDVVLRKGDDGVEKKVVGTLGEKSELLKGTGPGKWHDYQIEARGRELTHTINGQTIVKVVDRDDAFQSKGLLALQLHAGPAMKVQFKDIRLSQK